LVRTFSQDERVGASYRRITGNIVAKWVSPVIGAKPIRGLTRDDIEDVRDRLDRALDAKEIRHTTARNAWSALVGGLKAAYAARNRTLRVIASPIHVGILPPKRGKSRQRPWLYPREWLTFFGCERVPIAFRQTCALALYTGLRPGELRALIWADVDLAARTISVSKAWDPQTKSAKPPKTAAGQRVIPILDPLLPLLEALEGDPDELVLGSFNASEDHMATSFRTYLAAAGIDRPRLTADNPTEEAIDFRSLRDTHATWLSLGGVSDKVIQRRMGHASPLTTDRYIKAAESLATMHVGRPFPELPGKVPDGIGPRLGRAKECTPRRPRPLARLEILLAEALSKAATAGRWEVVAQLANELEARRRIAASGHVVVEDSSTLRSRPAGGLQGYRKTARVRRRGRT
jgi:integrase